MNEKKKVNSIGKFYKSYKGILSVQVQCKSTDVEERKTADDLHRWLSITWYKHLEGGGRGAGGGLCSAVGREPRENGWKPLAGKPV